MTAFVQRIQGINQIGLFFEKHPESDTGAFKRGSNDFTVCHYRIPGIGKIKFHGDLLPDKQPLIGVDKNTAGTDIFNGCLEISLHGPAIRNQQLGGVDIFAGIFSSF